MFGSWIEVFATVLTGVTTLLLAPVGLAASGRTVFLALVVIREGLIAVRADLDRQVKAHTYIHTRVVATLPLAYRGQQSPGAMVAQLGAVRATVNPLDAILSDERLVADQALRHIHTARQADQDALPHRDGWIVDARDRPDGIGQATADLLQLAEVALGLPPLLIVLAGIAPAVIIVAAALDLAAAIRASEARPTFVRLRQRLMANVAGGGSVKFCSSHERYHRTDVL